MDVYVALHSIFLISLLFSVFRLISGAGEVTTETSIIVTEGETATLPCTFDRTNLVSQVWRRGPDSANGEIVVRWFKTRLIPGNDRRFNLSSEFSLVLSNARQNDSNIYWCQVTLQGTFQSATNLTVLPVTTTSLGGTTAGTSVQPTKPPAPEKLISNKQTIYIIVGVVGGLIVIPILVLVLYCCCCKRKAPKGYDKPAAKPV